MKAAFERAARNLAGLSADQRAEMIQAVYSCRNGNGFDRIECVEADGVARVALSGTPVYRIIKSIRAGFTVRETLQMFPQLTVSDVAQACLYAERHLDVIEKQISAAEYERGRSISRPN